MNGATASGWSWLSRDTDMRHFARTIMSVCVARSTTSMSGLPNSRVASERLPSLRRLPGRAALSWCSARTGAKSLSATPPAFSTE